MIIDLLKDVRQAFLSAGIQEMPVLVVRERSTYDVLLNDALMDPRSSMRGVINPNAVRFQAHGVTVQYVERK